MWQKVALLLLFAGAAWAQNPNPCRRVTNSATSGYVLSAASTGATPNCTWIAGGGGGGGGTVTSFSGSGPSWLTWTVTNPTTTPAASLAPTTGQASHQVIGTCNALTAFAPCTLVAGDIPSLTSLYLTAGSDVQSATGKTIDGVTPTVFGFVDPTSSIQTQLNGKQASGAYATCTGDLSGTAPGCTVSKINGTSFAGTSGHLVSFGAANIPADSGVVAANAVVASSPGAGIAHFAGSTQTVTSSAVALTDLATQAADTVVINATAGAASPTAVAMPACTTGADLYNTSTHAWSCVSVGGTSGLTFVGSCSVSSAATCDVTSFISSTYDEYTCRGTDILLLTSTDNLWVRIGTGAGPTWQTTNHLWTQFANNQAGATGTDGSASDGKFVIGESLATTASGGARFTLDMSDPQNTTLFPRFNYQALALQSSGANSSYEGGARWLGGTAITGLRFMGSSGMITATVRCYGWSKS